ncbi:hypothetical protein PVL29_007221 [Vitis rotundifolia]|uniref:Uncharacterized protein n=1 Tax=Vitis rotundifolia TaxID=103349 RepID=A0AA39A173_VITRO|nr:hypothetical protein PVL29_007221 [Vitis rotundifolia]
MLLLQSLSPSPLPPLSLSSRQPISQFLSHCVGNHPTWSRRGRRRRRRRSSASSVSTVHAVDKDSQQFEVDPDKAREALQKLDQQLQSLSQKQVTPPRKTASNQNLAGDQMREEPVELSGSFLAYSALALLIFTIFYNVLFLTVIQPSIDGQ